MQQSAEILLSHKISMLMYFEINTARLQCYIKVYIAKIIKIIEKLQTPRTLNNEKIIVNSFMCSLIHVMKNK